MDRRPPVPVYEDLLEAQNEELQKQLVEKGIVELNQARVSPVESRLKIWQGDITRLSVDSVVNAANSQMLGCFVLLHSCINNAIHSAEYLNLNLNLSLSFSLSL
jgi:hypothetical protein